MSDQNHLVSEWYRQHARPLLTEVAADLVPEFDRHLEKVEALAATINDEVAVCFLGPSSVGKSTLINALVAGAARVLPQGGVGPLTALATSVRYAEDPYFDVVYQPRARLNELRFALEGEYKRVLKAAGKEVPVEIDSDEGKAGTPEPAVLPADDEPGDESRIVSLGKQTRLMVQGSQIGEIDLPYLADALRSALGLKLVWDRPVSPEDRERIERLRALLQPGEESTRKHRREARSNRDVFQDDLYEHVAGPLAPLVKELEVGWNSDILRGGITLVDLPGLGVANDEYRVTTMNWVKERARAVALVVDRSGIREAEADLLRSSGFFSRLLHAAGDPAADPVELMIVAVKIDLSAYDAWRLDRDRNGRNARPWGEHFREVQARMIDTLRNQLTEQLRSIGARGDAGIHGELQSVVARVLDTVQLHAVSAPEVSKLLAGDTEDPSKIQEPGQSGIPQLGSVISDFCEKHRTEVRGRIQEARSRFRERVLAAIEVIETQWEGGERPSAEAEKLRAELDTSLTADRRELQSRQGAFRELLKNGIPGELELLVEQAASSAEKEIQGYLNDLRLAHWSTLRAAIRRGGTFAGARHIDLPSDMAVRFEEPVAVVWSKKILAKLRYRTAQLGEDYVVLVERVVEWARQQGARIQPRSVEALRDRTKAETRQLAGVGKEAVDELRTKVKNTLFQSIQQPIRRRCERFVNEGEDVGPGVKVRMLRLIGHELAPLVTASAKQTATKILVNNYAEVEAEIRTAIDAMPDPIQAASEAVVASREQQIRRADTRRRRGVLDAISSIRKLSA
jgi:hypothetical protein